MIFVDIPFPPRIALGAEHSPGWKTTIAQTVAGFESADQRWAHSRMAYDVSFAVRRVSDYQAIRDHFHQVRGRAFSFPFRDALDHSVTAADGILTLLEDETAALLQMGKRYGVEPYAWRRVITRPVDTPDLTIYRTRGVVTTDATVDAIIDFDTGQVDMDGHQDGDTYTWVGEFVVPCRYDTDQLPTLIRNRQPGVDGELLVECASIPIVEVRER